MPLYPEYNSDLQAAATAYRQDSRFAVAYEYQYLKNLGQALDELVPAWLLTPPNRAALTRQALDNYHFAEDFKKLNRSGILLQPVFDALIANIRFSAELTAGFLTLRQAGILWLPGNIQALTQNPRLATLLARGFAALQQATLFSPVTRSFLLRFPQIIPSLLLFAKNKFLDQISFADLNNRLPYLKGLNAVFAELDQDGSLNKDTYPPVIKIAPQSENLFQALSQLRQVGRLKENFAALMQHVEHSLPLANGIFNFNYGEVPLTQEDLDLLFKFAPQAEPLSLVLIYLSHLDLLKTCRPVLAEQGQQAGNLLKLFEQLKQKQLFKPENIAAVFSQLHSLGKLLQACETQTSLTQSEFSALLGRTRAERRLGLHLKSLAIGTGSPVASQFFTLRLIPTGAAAREESNRGREFKT